MAGILAECEVMPARELNGPSYCVFAGLDKEYGGLAQL